MGQQLRQLLGLEQVPSTAPQSQSSYVPGSSTPYPSSQSAADYPTLQQVAPQSQGQAPSLNYYGPQSQQPGGFYAPEQARPWGSIWDIAKALPARAAADLIQVPTAALEYGLGRLAEPGSENTARSIDAATHLATLQQGPGRYALLTDPEVAQRAGIPVTQVPRGSINEGNAAQFGLSKEDAPFYPFVTQVPTHLAPAYTSEQDTLRAAQTQLQLAYIKYLHTGGEPIPGLVTTGQTTVVGPHGVSQSTVQGQPEVYNQGGTEPRVQRVIPPPGTGAVRPAPGPGKPTGAPGAPGGQGPATAPAAGAGGPTPPAAGAGAPSTLNPGLGPLGKPGENIVIHNGKTGGYFGGRIGPDGQSIVGGPVPAPAAPAGGAGGQGPGYPSAAFQEPGAAAGGAIGRALGGQQVQAPPAPIQGPGPGVAPQPGEVGYPSPAVQFPEPAADTGKQPIAVKGPIGGGQPAVRPPKQEATPGGPTPQMKQDYFAAYQANPALKQWVDTQVKAGHLSTLDDKVAATAYSVQQWKQDQAVILAQRKQAGRTAAPVQNQMNAINAMLDRYNTYLMPDPKTGRLPFDAFSGPMQVEVGQLLSGTGLGRFTSPSGVGVPNPFDWEGSQIIQTIPGMAKRPRDPDFAGANIILQNESGLLAELARATSVSGRLTNYEQQLMKRAYIPTAGIDDRASAMEKVKNTIATLRSIRAALIAGQTDFKGAAAQLRGGAGASVPGQLEAAPPEPGTAPPPE